jgi:CRP-like cAMP-binding protein
MSGEYKAIMSAERELVSRFEHVAQLTDREVDAKFDYYLSTMEREATTG